MVDTREGEALFTELIRRASGTRSVDSPIQPRDLEHKYASHSFFNLLYIAALRRGAHDWVPNRAIVDQPMTSAAKIEYHHIFPKALVQHRYEKEQWNSLANLAFVSAATNR
jgi:hypothetical protein